MAKKAYRPIITSDGRLLTREFSGKQLSDVSSYWARVGHAYEYGNVESLRNTPATVVRDTSGRRYTLSKDPNRVFNQLDSLSQSEGERFRNSFGSP